MVLKFTGERIVPGADNCEPTFAQKMYQEHIARYAFAAQFAEGADVLDVGCGVGYGSQWLARNGARSVLGIDLSEDAIEHARKYYFHPGATYRTQGATGIDAQGAYDLVTCFELIEHIERQEEVLGLIRTALKPDGLLVISTPRPRDEIRTHFHVHEMTFEEIYAALKAQFAHVEPYFEANHFTSFIGSSLPETIDRIVPIADGFDLDHADYFIFVASNGPPERNRRARPLLSINDDSYVLTLEHDVHVLRTEEEKKDALVSHLRDIEARQQGELDTVRHKLAATSERLASAETAVFVGRQENERLQDDINVLRHHLESTQASISKLKRSFSWKITSPLRWIGRSFRRIRGKGPR